jgi:biotin operon repressor
VAQVLADELGVSRRRVYQLAIQLRDELGSE